MYTCGARSCGRIPMITYIQSGIIYVYHPYHLYQPYQYWWLVTLPGEQNSTVPVFKGAAIAVAWTSNLGPSYLSGAIIIFTMQLLITNYNIPEYELTRLLRCVSSYLATFSPLSSSSVSTQLWFAAFSLRLSHDSIHLKGHSMQHIGKMTVLYRRSVQENIEKAKA